MIRRVIVVLFIILVVLFGFWRPLSERATIPVPVDDDEPESVAAPSINLAIESTGSCIEAPETRLQADMQAYVAQPDEGGGVRRNLLVRTEPNGAEIGVLTPGTSFLIIGMSVCADDELRWWPIQTLDGALAGWSVEGFAPDDYMISPTEKS